MFYNLSRKQSYDQERTAYQDRRVAGIRQVLPPEGVRRSAPGCRALRVRSPGDATPESDVDLLVILAGPVAFGRDLQTIIRALYPLQLETERALSAIPADEARYLSGEYAFRSAEGTNT